jgi:hypothetical protein
MFPKNWINLTYNNNLDIYYRPPHNLKQMNKINGLRKEKRKG